MTLSLFLTTRHRNRVFFADFSAACTHLRSIGSRPVLARPPAGGPCCFWLRLRRAGNSHEITSRFVKLEHQPQRVSDRIKTRTESVVAEGLRRCATSTLIYPDRHGLHGEYVNSMQGGTSGADSSSGGAARAALTAREWFEHLRDLRAAPPNRGFACLPHTTASPQTVTVRIY